MNRVRLISITAIGALIISFFILFSYLNLYEDGKIIPYSAQDEFYYQDFDEDSKKIFLFGRSFAARINGTLINEQLSNTGYDNYIFYNLAKVSENPIKVKNTLEKILYANPDLVLYILPIGELGYDLGIKNPQIDPTESIKLAIKYNEYLQILDPLQHFEEFLESNFLNSLYHLPNPKLSSLTIFDRTLQGDYNATKIYPMYDDKPFYESPDDATIILSNELLKKLVTKYEFIDITKTGFTKAKIQSLQEIIDELHKNHIKVIIIVPPHSKVFLDEFPSEIKQEISSKLETFRIENSVEIYNFLGKYDEQEIWSNLDHIAINPKSKVYSNDVAKIIIDEIKDGAL